MEERSYNYEAYRRRYEARKAAGMCPSHPNVPAAPGGIECAQCQERHAKLGRDRREVLFQNGRCKRCGRKRERREYAHCDACVEGYKMRRKTDARA